MYNTRMIHVVTVRLHNGTLQLQIVCYVTLATIALSSASL